MKRVHVCDVWSLGERARHPKFGGGVVLNGWAPVERRLREIKGAFPEDLTSAHIFHEVASTLGAYAALNSPNAIDWGKMVRGIDAGIYPRISALTVPAFGWRGCENGVLTSPDPTLVMMARYAHMDAIYKSKWLKQEGMGLGHVIWWPAFDAGPLPARSFGSAAAKARQAAWELLVKTWVRILKDSRCKLEAEGIHIDEKEPLMWLEWKPRVPGDDYINTSPRAIRFVNEVNTALGWRGMAINDEWAHLLLGGTTVEEGTRNTIEAGHLVSLVHANSADLAVCEWDNAGNLVSGTTGEDYDWFVGAGGTERWQDQRRAVKLLMETGQVITFEHDIDPAGADPLAYYQQSRSNLEGMIVANEAETA